MKAKFIQKIIAKKMANTAVTNALCNCAICGAE
jgi:hypothetical protein